MWPIDLTGPGRSVWSALFSTHSLVQYTLSTHWPDLPSVTAPVRVTFIPWPSSAFASRPLQLAESPDSSHRSIWETTTSVSLNRGWQKTDCHGLLSATYVLPLSNAWVLFSRLETTLINLTTPQFHSSQSLVAFFLPLLLLISVCWWFCVQRHYTIFDRFVISNRRYESSCLGVVILSSQLFISVSANQISAEFNVRSHAPHYWYLITDYIAKMLWNHTVHIQRTMPSICPHGITEYSNL